jgi:hypothetical protein
MPSTINAKITLAGAEKIAKALGGLATFDSLAYFVVSEGGWEDLGTGRRPRAPDAELLDVDAAQRPSRYPTDSRFYFQKNLTEGDFVFEAPGTLRVTCTLAADEANDDGNGDNPVFWELGVFAWDGNEEHAPTMLVHATFPAETKRAGEPLVNVVRIPVLGA